jgi:hypothetical protein
MVIPSFSIFALGEWMGDIICIYCLDILIGYISRFSTANAFCSMKIRRGST